MFLGIKGIKTKSKGSLIGKCLFLLTTTLISFLTRKGDYTMNYPKLRAVKKVCKTMLFPLKVIIFCYLVIMAYGGKVSVLSMIYRTAFVLILIQSLRQAQSENKIKIQTTGYIKFMHLLTQIFLIFFAMVVMFFRSMTQSSKASQSFSFAVNDFIHNMKEKYAEKAGKALLQVNSFFLNNLNSLILLSR